MKTLRSTAVSYTYFTFARYFGGYAFDAKYRRAV